MTASDDITVDDPTHAIEDALTAWYTNRPGAVRWRAETYADGRVQMQCDWIGGDRHPRRMRFQFDRAGFTEFASLIDHVRMGFNGGTLAPAGETG